MVILFWFTCLTLFLTISIILIGSSLKNPNVKDAIQTLADGFRDGLQGSGFKFKSSRYPVELYKWEVSSECEECEDCLERASWPPMDIADWMAEGLPGTPESDTCCHEECSCKLVAYQPKKHSKKYYLD